MQEFKHINLEEIDSPRNPIAILGLPGIGGVGRIAIDALIETLDATPILDFYSDDFPARVIVRDGISNFPKSSIHLYRAAPDEPHDVLLLSADHQPASGKGVFEYADYVVKMFVSLNVKSVYALAAYEQGYSDFFDSYPSPPRIFVSASSQEMLQRIETLDGIVPTKEGVITGANGFIPAWASTRYDLEGACFLGETLGMIKLDYRAAREVMQKMAILIGLKSQFDILDERVDQVVEFIDWAMDEIKQRSAQGDNSDSAQDRYIG